MFIRDNICRYEYIRQLTIINIITTHFSPGGDEYPAEGALQQVVQLEGVLHGGDSSGHTGYVPLLFSLLGDSLLHVGTATRDGQVFHVLQHQPYGGIRRAELWIHDRRLLRRSGKCAATLSLFTYTFIKFKFNRESSYFNVNKQLFIVISKLRLLIIKLLRLLSMKQITQNNLILITHTSNFLSRLLKLVFSNFQNGTFLAPTLSVPMMMFAGFGVSLRDLPGYLRWGSYISYLRYGLEG